MKKIILILVMISLISCKDEGFRLSKLTLKLEIYAEDLEYYPNNSKFHVLITEARTEKTYESYMNYEDTIDFYVPNGHYDIIVENVECVDGQYYFSNLIYKALSSDEVIKFEMELMPCSEENNI